MLLLAQSEPSVTPTSIGILVISLIYLSRWLWDYNRERRDAAAEFEPKASPALHKEYATKVELERIERDFKTSLAELAKLVKEEAQSQAGKRKAIYQAVEQLGRDMSATRVINESQTRQMHSFETKLENMPEKIIKLLHRDDDR